MITAESKRVIEHAKALYESQWRAKMESEHFGRYLAIEPESATYYVADSFAQAVDKARQACPNRLSFVLRIGHEAALHLGGVQSRCKRSRAA